MDLDEIPKRKKDGFPEGVSEVEYSTRAEMDAFLHGLQFVGDIDVDNGTPFERGGKFVVRVGAGDYGDEFEDEDNGGLERGSGWAEKPMGP